MRSVWLLALAASGCRAILGIGDPPALGDGGFVSCEGWHPEGFDPCALTITTDKLALGGAAYTYDTSVAGGTLYDAAHQAVVTSDQMIMQSDGSAVAVLAVGELTTAAGSTLAVVGPRPLLIASWSSITLDGALDAGSHLGVVDAAAHIAQTIRFGAGANQGCTGSAGHDGGPAMAGGSGGGGGGSFQAAGGGGGQGGIDAVAGGAAGAVAAIAILHGGCPGGSSGAAGSVARPPASAGSRALGGAGGGAIRLVAHDAIDVAGAVSANGAGGAGAPTRSACGGGGGGAGGYLGFEAPSVRFGAGAIVTANGGGGGGGGNTSETGGDGGDGVVGSQPAPGGAGAPSCGGLGGAGAAASRLGGATAVNASCAGGGGGGGGSSGFIVVRSPGFVPGAATVSPAAQIE
ncbi:MAG: hypothetical protein E6J90_46200 [Deltaproteobacteria bacterium]|nr:MAG: hypothetical protein E6J90_46200 [Deltaproteobacteria bacterium]